MWCTWTGSMANNVQVITVNGEQITGKTVKSMTFDAAENVTLLYSDDTSESIPAEQVKITIAYGTTAIKSGSIQMFSCNTVVGNSLNIRGIGEGENVEVFDAAGNAKASAKAGKDGVACKGVFVSSAKRAPCHGHNVVCLTKSHCCFLRIARVQL